jgi:ribosomal protein S12 methylthiotransferase accessory factor
MEKVINVTFPGGKKVIAQTGDRLIATDQPIEDGGQGTAPSPFMLFLASLATCAGYYALQFCLSRSIATNGMSCKAVFSFDEQLHRYTSVRIALTLPKGFPDKYRDAIVRAMDSCTVKKHLLQPPKFEITVF